MVVAAADKGKEVFIVDMGVYTRNRNFRLIYSTKVGKQLFLRPSAINRYVPPPQQNRRSDEEVEEVEEEMSYAWFLSSLVTRVGEDKETDMKKVYLLSCEPVPSEVRPHTHTHTTPPHTYHRTHTTAHTTRTAHTTAHHTVTCLSGRKRNAVLLALPDAPHAAAEPRHGPVRFARRRRVFFSPLELRLFALLLGTSAHLLASAPDRGVSGPLLASARACRLHAPSDARVLAQPWWCRYHHHSDRPLLPSFHLSLPARPPLLRPSLFHIIFVIFIFVELLAIRIFIIVIIVIVFIVVRLGLPSD
jgi:hypothetical protein